MHIKNIRSCVYHFSIIMGFLVCLNNFIFGINQEQYAQLQEQNNQQQTTNQVKYYTVPCPEGYNHKHLVVQITNNKEITNIVTPFQWFQLQQQPNDHEENEREFCSIL